MPGEAHDAASDGKTKGLSVQCVRFCWKAPRGWLAETTQYTKMKCQIKQFVFEVCQ